MRQPGRTAWTALFLVLSIPLAAYLLARQQRPIVVVRFGCFQPVPGPGGTGTLAAGLRAGSEPARALAEIVQRCEVDVLLVSGLGGADPESVDLLRERYLAVPQAGQRPIDFRYRFAGSGGGMVLLSRYPILADRAREFRDLPWPSMPDSLRPAGMPGERTGELARLSSRGHWDVPVLVTAAGLVIHVLCCSAAEATSGSATDADLRRNHDEVRFWVDYLAPERGSWIVDDRGKAGGLAEGEHFVLLGGLGCDPLDGPGRHEAVQALLAQARVQDPEPGSAGAAAAAGHQWGTNAMHRGTAALDTADFDDRPPSGPGNLRVDYALTSRTLIASDGGVFWPQATSPLLAVAERFEHRLVWVDVRVDEVGIGAGGR